MFLEKPKADMETAGPQLSGRSPGAHWRTDLTLNVGQTWARCSSDLPLAMMMPLQETCMFNGAQRDLFLEKKMKQIRFWRERPCF